MNDNICMLNKTPGFIFNYLMSNVKNEKFKVLSVHRKKQLTAKCLKQEQTVGEASLLEQVKYSFKRLFSLKALVVLGGVKKFERYFKVKIGNKTLDEVRRKYKVNGMNSIAEVMPLIGSYTGQGILRISITLTLKLKFKFLFEALSIFQLFRRRSQIQKKDIFLYYLHGG